MSSASISNQVLSLPELPSHLVEANRKASEIPLHEFEDGEGPSPMMLLLAEATIARVLLLLQTHLPLNPILQDPTIIQASPAYNGEFDVNFTAPGTPLIRVVFGFDYFCLNEGVNDFKPRLLDYADLEYEVYKGTKIPSSTVLANEIFQAIRRAAA